MSKIFSGSSPYKLGIEGGLIHEYCLCGLCEGSRQLWANVIEVDTECENWLDPSQLQIPQK